MDISIYVLIHQNYKICEEFADIFIKKIPKFILTHFLETDKSHIISDNRLSLLYLLTNFIYAQLKYIINNTNYLITTT